MKKYFPVSLWIQSTFLFSSFCCYSQFCEGATLTVTSNADSGANSLRNAITTASSGDTIVFNFSGSNTITLLSPLPLLNNLTIGNPLGASANINGGGHFVFFANSGSINLNNMNIYNAASIGGNGGANAGNSSGDLSNFVGGGGGGGGGGLGAGSGLFVNSGATVVLTDVTFQSNQAIGGIGGTGFFGPIGPTIGAGPNGGGGGGAGAFYGALSNGGTGGTGTWGGGTGIAGGGGGGGGGNLPGGIGNAGVLGAPTGASGGNGGVGGGFTGGAGGNGGVLAPSINSYPGLPGEMPLNPFNGGGGGGGEGAPYGGLTSGFPFGATGGAGADFGGGGGGGGAGGANPAAGAGGNAGFGGGGGGGGMTWFSFQGTGGMGGFGGGGGGGINTGGSSFYAGGTGGGGSADAGGGGGAALGGAIFVRDGGSLTINYTHINPALSATAISNNSVIGGTGAGGLFNEKGSAYGQDIFLNSGGELTFLVNAPLTISTAIASDPVNIGAPLIVQGSSILTLLGDNTFNGGVTINSGGELAIQNRGNLGINTSGTFLTLDEGSLSLISPGFTWGNSVLIGPGGGRFSVIEGASAAFLGSITGTNSSSNGGVTISGSGTTIFSGNNGYAGQTIIGPSATLQILSTQSLPSQGSIVLQGGVLDFASFQGVVPNSISGTGTLLLNPGAFPQLSGINTYSGNVSIAAGSTLGVLTNLSLSPYSTITNNGVLDFQYPSGVLSCTAIAGSGSVIMNGAGNLILSVDDTYSNGTYLNSGVVQISGASALGTSGLNFNGGTLELLNPFVGPITATAALQTPSGGIINVDSGVLAQYNGLITGPGGLACGGSGTLILSAPNNYASTTLIGPDATLQLTSILALPASSVVTDNGALVFSLTAAGATVQNLIQGSGSVTLTGPGTFLLQQSSNSYSEGTILSKGTLEVNASNTFSSLGGGPLTLFNGATLDVTTSSSTSKPFILGSSGSQIQIDAGVFSYSGSITAISGSPTLSIIGEGQIDFSGINFCSGTTLLGNGTAGNGTLALTDGTFLGPLMISANATLSGYGQVGSLINQGTINFDSAQPLNVDGTILLQGGELDFTVFQGVISTPISGTGNMVLSPGAFPQLSGTNTYSGNVSIAAGSTLGILRNSSLSPYSTITNNGVLDFQYPSGVLSCTAIAGSGSVMMNGSGNLILSVDDTYSNGTYLNSGVVQISGASALGTSGLSFNGGTLELLNSFVGPIRATATLQTPSGGIINVDSGVIAQYDGLITGPGGLACGGSGALILSAPNNYASTTLIGPDATLQLTSILALPASSVVTDNGTLVFSLTAAGATVQNLIEGSGSVTLTGPGTFLLQQSSNSYSEGTILSTGTLEVNASNTFSSLGGGPLLLFNGGTLEVTTSSSTSKPLILGSGGGQIQIDAGAFSYSGPITAISGTPTLSIIGEGEMEFSGTSFSSGTTLLGNGTEGNGILSLIDGTFSGPLTINTHAALNGYGQVGNLTNEGTITLDPSQALSVDGNYTQDSLGSLQVQIAGGGNHSALNISQTATLDGTLEVIAPSGAYLFGTEYTIITAGDPISPFSSFSTVILPTTPQLLLTYNRDPSVTLTVISQSILETAHVHHHNPQQVLTNLQEIIHTPSSDLVQVIESMVSLNTDQLTAALDQLHPAQFGAFELLNANTSSMLTSIFTRHTAESCCLHLNQECGCSNTSLWIQPFGYLYDQNQIGEQLGFNATAKGLAAGFNFCSMSGILVGIGGGYSSSELHWNQHRGHGSMDKASIAVYSDYATDKLSVEMSVIGSLDVFTASREINFSTIDRTARHQKSGYDFTAHLGGGRDIRLGTLFLRPFMNFDYLYLYQKGFTESGAQSLDLSVQGRRSNMLRSEVGLSLTRSFHLGKKGCFSPTIWVSGINEAYLIKRHYTATFIGETPDFSVRTFSNPLYLLSPGIDLSFMFRCGLGAAVRYSAELNDKVTVQKMDARLEWFF